MRILRIIKSTAKLTDIQLQLGTKRVRLIFDGIMRSRETLRRQFEIILFTSHVRSQQMSSHRRKRLKSFRAFRQFSGSPIQQQQMSHQSDSVREFHDLVICQRRSIQSTKLQQW